MTLEEALRSLDESDLLKDNAGEVWSPDNLLDAMREGEAVYPDVSYGATLHSEVSLSDVDIRLVKPDGYIDTGEALYTFVQE